MNTVKGALRNHLRERPFDFYIAAILVGVGIYSIVSDSWPENFGHTWIEVLINIISIYYMCAGIVIMSSLTCKRGKYPLFALFGEMYGWMFVSFAALATVILYFGAVVGDAPHSWWLWMVMVAAWAGLFISSGVRFLDLYLVYRGIKK